MVGTAGNDPASTAFQAVTNPSQLRSLLKPIPYIDFYCWSVQGESNTRPPAPKAGAATRLSYALIVWGG